MELGNGKHEAFAQLVVTGLSFTEAAVRAGFAPSSAHNMGSRTAKLPAVRARIQELRAQRGHKTTFAGVRDPNARVTAMESRWMLLRQIIDERAKDPDMAHVPGGTTGLLVMTVKQIGNKENFQVVREYRVDRELLAEMRELERQCAEDLGQFSRKTESFSTNVSMGILDKRQLNEMLKSQMDQLAPEQRARLLAESPDLSRVVVDLEGEPDLEPLPVVVDASE